ncbi:MAG: S41 family peptidase [Pseudohongiellaceae bacterium]|nr:S41 family peptidase [Pseudohongiellaceae bacterium]
MKQINRFTSRFRDGKRLAVSLLALSLCAPLAAQEQAVNGERLPLPFDEVRIFAEALDNIRNSYVREVDDKTLLEYAIKGMLSSLDPHSAYLAAREYDSLQETTQGEFGGLGIEVGEQDGLIKVISPIDDTPADRAGIESGDLIIEIDGKPLRDMPISEAVELMRGAIGTTIDLGILREGEPEILRFTLEREAIAIASVRHRELEPGYAYLRISQFKINTGEEVREALSEIREEQEDLKGLVLDLRNNPGGILQASVEVVDSFISEGKIVYTQGRKNEIELEYFATPEDLSDGVPMVVLINSGSASAAEIVAGALQDHGRAVIMGTRSFGKGSVQTVMALAQDRAIKLTTSLYYTPNGRSIQAQGIEPDIEIEEGLVTRSTERAGYTEADLEGHLRNGNDLDDLVRERGNVSAEQVVVTDYQLNQALTLLRGLNILQPKQAQTTTKLAKTQEIN